jgi:hypothetical protein
LSLRPASVDSTLHADGRQRPGCIHLVSQGGLTAGHGELPVTPAALDSLGGIMARIAHGPPAP